jgi:hypothetical protein
MSNDRDMSGALFRNDRKEKPTHADYRGDVLIEGRKYWLSGWIKETRDGKKFLSLSVRSAEEPGKPARATDRDWQRPPADSDLPF